ncbi:hypothetical protein CK203_019064 [Vitis vinifera]|uniref:Reverse transcriptase zinc-binding domain-containing protein n=1 Tax=Vitis vinifera TaxID=29760 RepID=A0A438IQW2_VITVI|nr:hypothetical protein CK203_019064 [Vitis vinifera]
MAFWQFAWDFVKEEVMNLFRQFHETRRFVKSLNATFLVLIPKKGGVEDLKDFRPISVVGGLYKWLAKVLANRVLGMPLGVPFKSIGVWDGIEERFRKRLTMWKR